MKCPVCKDVTLLMSERQGIEIDYCPECRGIWLDRGELDKLLDKERKFNEEHSEPHHAPYHHDEYEKHKYHDKHDDHHDYYHDDYKKHKHPHKRKKESFIEDIFDIF